MVVMYFLVLFSLSLVFVISDEVLADEPESFPDVPFDAQGGLSRGDAQMEVRLRVNLCESSRFCGSQLDFSSLGSPAPHIPVQTSDQQVPRTFSSDRAVPTINERTPNPGDRSKRAQEGDSQAGEGSQSQSGNQNQSSSRSSDDPNRTNDNRANDDEERDLITAAAEAVSQCKTSSEDAESGCLTGNGDTSTALMNIADQVTRAGAAASIANACAEQSQALEAASAAVLAVKGQYLFKTPGDGAAGCPACDFAAALESVSLYFMLSPLDPV